MKRTLTRRGLAVVFAAAATLALTAAPASAWSHRPGGGHGRHLVLTGGWTDPGPVIDGAVPNDDGTYQVTLHGGTHTTGGFTGQSTYTMDLRFDPATNGSVGRCRETFLATAGHRTGHVFLRERVVIHGDGATVVTGPIVGGDGGFRGAHGSVRFTGTTDPSGSGAGSGTYVVRLELDR